MDIELIRNKFIDQQKPCCNKKFLKKMILSNCLLNAPDEWTIRNLINSINRDDFTDEQKEKLLQKVKEEYNNEKKKYETFLNNLFSEKKETSIATDDSATDDSATDDSATDNNEGEY